MKKRLYLFCGILSVVLCLYVATENVNFGVLSKYGTRGEEVRQIQTKLKEQGFYTHRIDGIYGWRTTNAVRQFQQKNGLRVDGVAGSATLSALGLRSNGPNSADEALLARVISAEAKGESYTGQVAVGAVVLNRVEHPSFPQTVAGVVYQPGAFSSVDDGQINNPVSETSKRAAKDALNGWDPSGGAIYFYNPVKSTSKWIFSRPTITTIGNHIFAR